MSKTKKNPKHYINNREFYNEVVASQKEGRISPRLAEMFSLLAERYGTRPNFSGYSYLDEMVCAAKVALCAGYTKFDPERFDNPLAYFTSVTHSAFLQVLNKEQRQRDIRDQILVDNDLEPSTGYADRVKEREKKKAKAAAEKDEAKRLREEQAED